MKPYFGQTRVSPIIHLISLPVHGIIICAYNKFLNLSSIHSVLLQVLVYSPSLVAGQVDQLVDWERG